VVRECLTNAARHAPGEPLTLVVQWTPEGVEVRAVNQLTSRRAAAPGRGLTGMRHRAELLGGTFEASSDAGQFDVRVAIPSKASP
jgi:signal transduction histidine kinase